MSHFAKCLSNQEGRRDPEAVRDVTADVGNLRGHNESVGGPGADRSASTIAAETVADLNRSHSFENAGGTQAQLAMEEGEKKHYDNKYGRAKQALSETRYQAAKSAKYALNFVLVLPTDFTLSLSKGFHNAPKLYHDDTVEPIPKVIGIKSGFRAAGKVSTYLFTYRLRNNSLIYRRSYIEVCILACLDLSRSLLEAFGNQEVKG